jgi:nitrile hydratase
VNGVHDMGGMQGFGPVVAEPDEPVFHASWEGRVLALNIAGFGFGRWTLDAWRHQLERTPPADYLRIGYYERWLGGLTELLVGAGVVSRAELASGRSAGPAPAAPPRSAAAQAPKATPRFALGDAVRARKLNPEGHTRLPRYVRGCAGRVVALHGLHTFPDANAHGLGRQPQPLYQVRFEGRELWGEAAEPKSAVHLDLWESYLEPA